MNKPKLIVFDLNKTLIEENTWQDLNLAMGVSQAEDDVLVAWGQEGIISDAEGQDILCRIYRERGNPTRERITDIIWKYQYRPEAKETIKKLKELGFTIALISGSMDILVEHVAKELGIQHWASNNRFIFDDTNVLLRIETEDNDYIYKVRQLEKLCKELGLHVTDSVCVGDGANDVMLFEACGNGVTFSDSKYAHTAKYTVQSLEGLVTIFH